MTAPDAYYAIVQVLALLLAVALGWTRAGDATLRTLAVAVGIATTAALHLLEGGPGLVLGLVVYPVICVAVASTSRAVKEWHERRTWRRSDDQRE